MKLKCDKCAAKCKLEVEIDLQERHIDKIPCIASRTLYIASPVWELDQCPQCGADLGNGKCKANCESVGV